jgi:hypothetical protein
VNIVKRTLPYEHGAFTVGVGGRPWLSDECIGRPAELDLEPLRDALDRIYDLAPPFRPKAHEQAEHDRKMSLMLSTASADQIVDAFRESQAAESIKFFSQKICHEAGLVIPALVMLRDAGEIQLTSLNFHDFFKLEYIETLHHSQCLPLELRQSLRSYVESEDAQTPSGKTQRLFLISICTHFLQGSARVEVALRRIARQLAASVRDHKLATYRDLILDFIQIRHDYPAIKVSMLVDALEAAGVQKSDYIQGFAMDERGQIFTTELGV